MNDFLYAECSAMDDVCGKVEKGGGEEYTSCSSVTLDEENNEMFINDFWTRKIKVYDLEGNFKRSIKQKQEVSLPDGYGLPGCLH